MQVPGPTGAQTERNHVQYERPVIWSEQYHNVPSLPSDNSFPGVVTSYQAQYEKLWGK